MNQAGNSDQVADQVPALTNLDDFFTSDALCNEWANKVVDQVGNFLAYPVAFAVLRTDPNRFEDFETLSDNALVIDEVALLESLTEGVRFILAAMRSDLVAHLNYGH